jgi:hypothetical protein
MTVVLLELTDDDIETPIENDGFPKDFPDALKQQIAALRIQYYADYDKRKYLSAAQILSQIIDLLETGGIQKLDKRAIRAVMKLGNEQDVYLLQLLTFDPRLQQYFEDGTLGFNILIKLCQAFLKQKINVEALIARIELERKKPLPPEHNSASPIIGVPAFRDIISVAVNKTLETLPTKERLNDPTHLRNIRALQIPDGVAVYAVYGFHPKRINNRTSFTCYATAPDKTHPSFAQSKRLRAFMPTNASKIVVRPYAAYIKSVTHIFADPKYLVLVRDGKNKL